MTNTTTTIQDFTITRYELDELTYEQAVDLVKEQTKGDDMALTFWLMELRSAQVLKEEDLYNPDLVQHWPTQPTNHKDRHEQV